MKILTLSTLSTVLAAGLALSLQLGSPADSPAGLSTDLSADPTVANLQLDISGTQHRKVLTQHLSARAWPEHNVANGEEPIAGSYTHRLNQLVLDDNVRSLRLSVHSDFARNTPSFKRIENLVAVLSDRNGPEKERWLAAQALGESKHVVAVLAVPALLQAMQGDPDLTVRNYAALALVKVDLRSAINPLLQALESSDPDTKQMSAAVLHSAGHSAVSELVRIVRCPDPYMKRLACLGLAEVGAPATQALSVLREAASDSDSSSLYTPVAFDSIKAIEKAWQAKNAATEEMPFDPDIWKADGEGVYRSAMLKSVLCDQFLLGRTTGQLRNLLGEGLSFDEGKELRYSVGKAHVVTVAYAKKHQHDSSNIKDAIAAAQANDDMWLVLALERDVVTGFQVKAINQSDWNIHHQDLLMEAMALSDRKL